MRASHSILNDLSLPACQALTWYTENTGETIFIGKIEESPNIHLLLTRADHSTKFNPEFRKGSGHHVLCECICPVSH